MAAHLCSPPDGPPDTATAPNPRPSNAWWCSICGAGWLWEARTGDRSILRGWTRWERGDDRVVREAFLAEAMARGLPWWRIATRIRLSREARDNRSFAAARREAM